MPRIFACASSARDRDANYYITRNHKRVWRASRIEHGDVNRPTVIFPRAGT
jgi:hypothetical protein